MKLSFEEKENFAKSMALIINAGFDVEKQSFFTNA